MAINGKKAQEDRVPASDVQSLVRESTSSGNIVQMLKGQEVAECQNHTGVSLELRNCKETLWLLKWEIDMGLQKLDWCL